MNPRKRISALSLGLAVMAVALLAGESAAQTGGALSLVPSDATTVGLARISDLRTSAITGRLFSETDKSIDGEAARFMSEAGLKPAEDVDVAVVSLTPTASGKPQVLVGFEGRFDPARLAEAIVSRGAIKKATPNGIYFLLPGDNEEQGSVAFLSSSLVIAGHESSVASGLA
ncbi:MAG TPA: hypothetical protein VMS12_07710, partial [Thermoanaerobaculia bacterium]|nr:hypothetical protein [Thermoanaerobaculia bacterium]